MMIVNHNNTVSIDISEIKYIYITDDDNLQKVLKVNDIDFMKENKLEDIDIKVLSKVLLILTILRKDLHIEDKYLQISLKDLKCPAIISVDIKENNLE